MDGPIIYLVEAIFDPNLKLNLRFPKRRNATVLLLAVIDLQGMKAVRRLPLPKLSRAAMLGDMKRAIRLAEQAGPDVAIELLKASPLLLESWGLTPSLERMRVSR